MSSDRLFVVMERNLKNSESPEQLSRYLAENVVLLRQKMNFSQDQLAKTAGIPRTTLSSIESGSGNPSLANLARISMALHVGLDELLTRPRNDCLLVKSVDVPVQMRNRGQASLHKLLPDKVRGLEIDRIEIKADGTMGGHPHLAGTKEYLIGVAGEIVVHVAGEEFTVSQGDVMAFPGDQRHSYRNLGRQAAMAFSVVVPVPAGV